MKTLKENLAKLNEDQYKAATNFIGPYFIVAGPGSGKTATMVQRVAYMISQGVKASSIILFTFTNKAANELKERVVSMVGESANGMVVGTYHSVCARLLRRYANILGHYDSNFSIYDVDDIDAILKPLIKMNYLEEEDVVPYISMCKNNMITPTEAYRRAETSYEQRMALVYGEYQSALEKSNAMDFDDLIWNMIKVMELNSIVKRDLNEQYRFILSDESHDSNKMDLRLIELLAGHEQNVCFILDPNQSIYRFRGADIDSVMNVSSIYKNITTYQLKTNYRSSETIIKASESLIEHNPQMSGREVKAFNKGGEKLYYLESDSREEEANNIALLIKTLKESGENLNDIAVLVRMNFLTRELEKALILNNIPFETKGTNGFFQRREIKDIMAYIKFALNPYDLSSFKRVINLPKRGIGERNQERIINNFEESPEQENLLEVAKKTELKGKAKTGLDEFINIIEKINMSINSGDKVGDIVKNVVEETKMVEYISKEKDKSVVLDRIANVNELIDFSYNFMNIMDMVQSISIYDVPEEESDDSIPKVQLMTLHGSKGLEWPNVIMAGLTEGVLPHYRSIDEGEEEVNEERRLCYVGMTRAEKRLFLSRPKTSFRMGRVVMEEKSRFLNEIDKKYITKIM